MFDHLDPFSARWPLGRFSQTLLLWGTPSVIFCPHIATLISGLEFLYPLQCLAFLCFNKGQWLFLLYLHLNTKVLITLFSAWVCAIFLSLFFHAWVQLFFITALSWHPSVPQCTVLTGYGIQHPLEAKRVIFSLPIARTSRGRLWLGFSPWTCYSDAFLWGHWPTDWAHPASLQACLSECVWVARFPQFLFLSASEPPERT